MPPLISIPVNRRTLPQGSNTWLAAVTWSLASLRDRTPPEPQAQQAARPTRDAKMSRVNCRRALTTSRNGGDARRPRVEERRVWRVGEKEIITMARRATVRPWRCRYRLDWIMRRHETSISVDHKVRFVPTPTQHSSAN